MLIQKQYTVVGVDGLTNQRYLRHFNATSVDDAEHQAYWLNEDLLIAAVFEDHVQSVDTRASALYDQYAVAV